MSFQPHDVVPDSPINNFATLNPLFRNSSLMSDGNTKFNKSTVGWATGIGTINLNNGNKYYFEGMPTLVGGPNSGIFIGLTKDSATQDTFSVNGIWSFGGTGSVLKIYNQTTLVSPTGSSAASDVFKVCFDSSNGYLWFGKNSDWYDSSGGTAGDPSTNSNPSVTISDTDPLFPIVTAYANAIIFNFGQDHTFGGAKTGGGAYTDANGIGQFYYQPPAGALALCTQNIPSGPIDIANDDVPADYMKAVTYTGNGGTQSIDVGFQPDLVWGKSRNHPTSHELIDSVRGAGKQIFSDSTGSEASTSKLSSFTSSGFELIGGGNLNTSAKTYVAWCWKAAGAPAANEARIIDTNGSLITKTTADLKTETGASITPSKVSANRKSGFSIIKYTGTGSAATIPHGLSAAPEFMLVKPLDTANSWVTYDKTSGGTNYMALSTTQASSANSTRWNNTNPTTTVFSVGNHISVSDSGKEHIAYCWHSVSGYSKFGSYVGNGSADGPYVELGFRPAWVMVKRTDAANNWVINDSTRSHYNEITGSSSTLYADTSGQESWYSTNVDFLSNGFKARTTGGHRNGTGGTYIYAAFAESPFNAPATAR